MCTALRTMQGIRASSLQKGGIPRRAAGGATRSGVAAAAGTHGVPEFQEGAIPAEQPVLEGRVVVGKPPKIRREQLEPALGQVELVPGQSSPAAQKHGAV